MVKDSEKLRDRYRIMRKGTRIRKIFWFETPLNLKRPKFKQKWKTVIYDIFVYRTYVNTISALRVLASWYAVYRLSKFIRLYILPSAYNDKAAWLTQKYYQSQGLDQLEYNHMLYRWVHQYLVKYKLFHPKGKIELSNKMAKYSRFDYGDDHWRIDWNKKQQKFFNYNNGVKELKQTKNKKIKK